MYEFVTGPLVWLSFAIFFIGLIVRTVLYIKGLDWKLDRVTYSVNTSYGVRGAVRSLGSSHKRVQIIHHGSQVLCTRF
jgi:hypothetical protein